ncbi:ABC transporter ATP-binding protein [Streptacidiphilus pinicola]|uniref:ABC transporter ATP-binding protein n=1 Tax=Streptacidiphilus pinicola TaxID=2219663 RepID=A0A2X0KIQ1_9ACTN|nr:ABC transporter ATP-binding protein [Streptacidiphilus pinicola]RAG86620.1 ABC transporter ATP-binding protein [Streptacidiphilus pinicola]
MTAPLLELAGLTVDITTEDGGTRTLLDGIDLSLAPGEALGLVGESGSGKSMTMRAVTRLLPRGAAVSGAVRYDGAEVLAMDAGALRRYRDREVGLVFQDPRAHVNPTRRIGAFLIEALVRNRGVGKREALARAAAVLAEVGIDDPQRRLRQYPHEVSGGMLQRVMIASVLLAEPRLILADEPTTALDVTIQREVVGILDRLRRERGMGMVFITHDLDLALAVCGRVAVMYAGRIVELRSADTLHERAAHPYTLGLLGSRPSIDERAQRLTAIPGRPVSAFESGPGCAFAPRCGFATAQCETTPPALAEFDDGLVRCSRVEEIHAARTEATA